MVVWSGAVCVDGGVPTGVSFVGGGTMVSGARGSSSERMEEAHCSTAMGALQESKQRSVSKESWFRQKRKEN